MFIVAHFGQVRIKRVTLCSNIHAKIDLMTILIRFRSSFCLQLLSCVHMSLVSLKR